MFKEKNGLEVVVVGKRLIIYAADANVVGKEKLKAYAWEVKHER